MYSFRYSIDGNEFNIRVPESPESIFEAATIAVWGRFGEQPLTFDTYIHVEPTEEVVGGRLRVGDVLHWLQTPEGHDYLNSKHDNVKMVLDKVRAELTPSIGK